MTHTVNILAIKRRAEKHEISHDDAHGRRSRQTPRDISRASVNNAKIIRVANAINSADVRRSFVRVSHRETDISTSARIHFSPDLMMNEYPPDQPTKHD